MYIKYIINSTAADTAWDLMRLITGQITTIGDCVGAGLGSSITGTGPTAGTYHTPYTGHATATAFTSQGQDDHFNITKKHVQYDAANFNSEIKLKMLGTSGQGGFSPMTKNMTHVIGGVGANGMSQLGVTHAIGREYHLIVNDTTLAMQSVDTTTADPTNQIYSLCVHSDFVKNDYDVDALSQNDQYYPGCWMQSGSENPNDNYHMETNWAKNGFAIGRVQAWKPDSTFFNTQADISYNSAYNMYQTSTGTTSTNYENYCTMVPSPAARVPETPTSTGAQPSLIPCQWFPMNWAGYAHSDTNPDVDTRYHSVMLNTYRTADSIGSIGDTLQTADTTEYVIFRGHRPSSYMNSTTNNAFQPSCWTFPINNVGV
jgi:hypothetical protein